MSRPYLLADSTWETVRHQRYEVAVLPWGATEAHNRHLPYATDTMQCDAVAAAAAAMAWEAGARVLVLPTVPFGVQTGQLDLPGCLNLNPSTQLAVLGDLVASLPATGVRKLVILNGHGGNDFRQIIRELGPRTELFLCQLNWYTAVNPGPYFDVPGDHAGELETSVMLHIAPALVAPLDTAGPGTARPFAVTGLTDGTAWAPRHWPSVTDDTGVGDPRAATAAKGATFLDAVATKIGRFLIDLAAADPENLYRKP
ncbi:MAG: creatininase family protein [Gemmatimonadales bacterium]